MSKHNFDYTTPTGSPDDVYNGKVWYGSRDPKPVVSPDFATWELARRWIFQQPKIGRYKASRRSIILRNKMLHMTVEG
jgi:hypothetical protein